MRRSAFVLVGSLILVTSAPAGAAQAGSKAAPQRGVAPAAAGDALTNDQIILMVQNKLSDNVVITSIETEKATALDATPTGLLALKTGRVSDKVISAIQKVVAEKQTGSASRFSMTNDDVIKMSSGRIRLSDAIIIQAIRNASSATFDVSPKGLIDLKTGKVGTTVVQVMQTIGSTPAAAPAPPAKPAAAASAKPAPASTAKPTTAKPATGK